MMNRRWFFTATGSAFLAASCTIVRNKRPQVVKRERPETPDAQFELLLDIFFVGLQEQIQELQKLPTNQLADTQLPRSMPELQQRFRQPLATIYRKRFDFRLESGELSNPIYELLLDQSCVLGQLTGLAFAYETGLVHPQKFSFEKPDPRPVLGTKHLEWARDTYGLYTNSKIAKRHEINLCGESGGPVQIDDPCPFCYA